MLSQEEIDAILKDMAKNDPDQFKQLEFDLDIDFIQDYNETNNCMHEWIEYIGFNEKYEFCKLCGQKR